MCLKIPPSHIKTNYLAYTHVHGFTKSVSKLHLLILFFIVIDFLFHQLIFFDAVPYFEANFTPADFIWTRSVRSSAKPNVVHWCLPFSTSFSLICYIFLVFPSTLFRTSWSCRPLALSWMSWNAVGIELVAVHWFLLFILVSIKNFTSPGLIVWLKVFFLISYLVYNLT